MQDCNQVEFVRTLFREARLSCHQDQNEEFEQQVVNTGGVSCAHFWVEQEQDVIPFVTFLVLHKFYLV